MQTTPFKESVDVFDQSQGKIKSNESIYFANTPAQKASNSSIFGWSSNSNLPSGNHGWQNKKTFSTGWGTSAPNHSSIYLNHVSAIHLPTEGHHIHMANGNLTSPLDHPNAIQQM